MNQYPKFGKVGPTVDARLEEWDSSKFAERLWRKDPTLWSDEPLPELADRMGWLDLPRQMTARVDELTAFGDEVRAEKFQHAVLLGMGGSSLAPEVFQRTFGNRSGHPELIVLDSTHPDAVRAVDGRIDPARTLFFVSSKSGGTTETLSFFKHFWQRVNEAGGDAGRHFVAITDPGTSLETLAGERGFRRVFSAPPDVGGRYSALSVFGLVPAAAIGVDVGAVLASALDLLAHDREQNRARDVQALVLGAAMGELALSGRDKVTITTTPSLRAFPDWVEQLIAESTGKDDKGIVPIVGEPLAGPEVYGPDRFFVHIALRGESDSTGTLAALEEAGHPVAQITIENLEALGQEFLRWEVAVAAAGAVLGIHPFNQPDVQLAKELAKKAMASAGAGGAKDDAVDTLDGEDENTPGAIAKWLAQLSQSDYVAVQAYVAPRDDTRAVLEQLRVRFRDQYQVATTFGYGPRFLHSTGQLHKGGANNGMFLQIIDDPSNPLPVPEADYSFAQLIRAQAMGDAQALLQRGRRVLRVKLGARGVAPLAR